MNALLSWLRRRWLLVLVTAAFVLFVIVGFEDLRALGATLIRGEWQWILAAVLAQSAYYLLYALEYQLAFATVGVVSRVVELIPVLLASIFVRTVVPSGGVSGAALFIDDAARRGQSGARAAEGSLLVLTLDLATMMPLIAYALAFLSREGALMAYQLVGSALFTLFIAALVAGLLLGHWDPRLLRRLLSALRRAVNQAARKLGRPTLLPADWVTRNTNDFTRAANDIATHRTDLKRTLGVAMAAQLVNLVTVDVIGRAYRQPLALGAVVAAFSMEAVFSVVTVTPNGLILAEAVMVAVLGSLGVPFGNAILITIIYRGLSVWLPLGVGFLLLRYVKTFQRGKPDRDGV